MQFKALVSDPIAKEGVAVLEQSGIFARVDVRTGMSAEDFKAILPNYDALLVRSMTKVRADDLAHAPGLKVIGRAGAGVDNVDVKAATANKTLVMNTPGGNNNAVAELVLGFLFALARKLPDASLSTRDGKWEKSRFVGGEIEGRVLGVVGVGAIGRIVARKAQGLGMTVLAYDPALEAAKIRALGARPLEFDELLAQSDVITVHVPLLPATRGLFGAAAFAKMKRGAWLVHAARGGIVVESDLLAALQSGQIGAAALDVFAEEPVPADHPLLRHPNVIATPHIGASTREAQDKVGVQIAEQVVRYLRDGIAENAVNLVA
ncbi:MAG: hydroxyacid dehydrogenase [Myxococcales bacterium]|nr:hydroxyacid dehydrogenase [Myxococcales bacterium]